MANNTKYHWLEELPSCGVDASQISVLTDTVSFRRELLSLIQTAKRRIYLAALYLQNDEGGREILTALYQAKADNPDLDVQILVDFHRAQRGLIGKGPQVGNDAFYREMAEQFAPVQIGIHGVPVKSREWAGVLHLKGFVFDDTVLYSGASFNNVYLGVGGRYRYDRYHKIESPCLADDMVRFMSRDLIDSDAVVSLLETPVPSSKALKRSIRQLKNRLGRSAYGPDCQSAGPIRVYPLLGLGRKANLLNRSIVRLLLSAQSEVFICTPYFNLPGQLTLALRRLLRGGVKITLVVGDKTANDFFIPADQPFSPVGALPYLYEQNLKRFARKNQKFIDNGQLNLQLWRHEGNSFHLKGIQVDNDAYLLTGNNLNPRAWALDLENGLLLQDPQLQLQPTFQHERNCILANTTRLSHFGELETRHEYPAPVARLLKRLGRVKADLLLKRIL